MLSKVRGLPPVLHSEVALFAIISLQVMRPLWSTMWIPHSYEAQDQHRILIASYTFLLAPRAPGRKMRFHRHSQWPPSTIRSTDSVAVVRMKTAICLSHYCNKSTQLCSQIRLGNGCNQKCEFSWCINPKLSSN